MNDLQTLRAALEAEPRDRACWAAYGDAFEDQYGQEARRLLACRRVRDNAEFLALGADVSRLTGGDIDFLWSAYHSAKPFGHAGSVQYRYGLPCFASLLRLSRACDHNPGPAIATVGFLSFVQGPVRRVTWRHRPGERWGCSQRQQDIEVPLHGGGTCERAPGFYASLVVASGWPGGGGAGLRRLPHEEGGQAGPVARRAQPGPPQGRPAPAAPAGGVRVSDLRGRPVCPAPPG